MTALSAQGSTTIAMTLFVGVAMLRLGFRKKSLRWRLSSRCPSCGLIRRSSYCKNCAS